MSRVVPHLVERFCPQASPSGRDGYLLPRLWVHSMRFWGVGPVARRPRSEQVVCGETAANDKSQGAVQKWALGSFLGPFTGSPRCPCPSLDSTARCVES